MHPHPTTPLVLALDQGGHASRAIVFDAAGRAVARSSRPVTETRIGDDRVEQDPEELVRSVRDAAVEGLREVGSRARVVCAGLATQRSSLVCWDRKSGAALSPVISWQDRRASAWLERFASDADEIHRRTGLFLSPHYGASKIAWCLRELPEVARARERRSLAVGPLASFLAFRLLRERPFVVDAANGSRTLLLSIAERAWDPYLCERFGIPTEILPQCVATESELGTLELAGLDIPLRVITGDQSAAIFAQGAPSSDTAYVNVGTGAFVQRPFSGALILLPRLLTSLVSSGHRGGAALFVLEGTINGAGSALRSIESELGLSGAEAHLDEWLASVREPPLFLNGVSGLAAPYWSPHFASRFVGPGTSGPPGSPEARVVAVVESILFLVKIILDEMGTALPAPSRIEISGGLSHSDALCARLADATGIAVRRALDPEATARGLAWQAFDRAPSWRDAAARTFEPRRDAELADRCARFRRELERALGLEA